MNEKKLGPGRTPFDAMGVETVARLAKQFYDYMDEREPELVAVHRRDESGKKVTADVRERFRLFLIEWLGGPNVYSSVHGHPRLRMRHHHVPIGVELRDAWMRCMNAALEDPAIDDDVRNFLRRRFAEVADFLRNQ